MKPEDRSRPELHAPTEALQTPSPGSTQVQSPDEQQAARELSTHNATRSIPGYEILRPIGRGGMGIVYLAKQVALNRTVALKMILGGDHAPAKIIERFVAEGQTVAALTHPNIVQVFEAGAHIGLPYLALEFVAGGSLEAKARPAPLEPKETAKIVQAIARGVQAAHEKGIIHRDLKPDNVLLTPDGTPKITDFGLAKQFHSQGLTPTGDVIGTPYYMAPEQARGESGVGPWTDIWAVGAILYRLLTGRPPFQAATSVLTLEQVLKVEPAQPRVVQPTIPRDLETVCMKCLQKDPSKRYATAAELAADLQRFLNKEPILARPVGMIERASRWCGRNPALAGLLGALALVIVVALVGMTTLWLQAKRDGNIAQEQKEKAVEARKDAIALSEIAKANETKAREAVIKARQERQRATDVAYFLGELFKAADPIRLGFATALIPREHGEAFSAEKMLRDGAKQIAAATKFDPQTKANLHLRIGSSFLALGDREAAQTQLELAKKLFEEQDPPDHGALADVYQNLAWLRFTVGDYEDSDPLYRRALDHAARADLGFERDYRLTGVRIQYAILLAEQEDFDKAMQTATEARDGRIALLASENPDDPRLGEVHFAYAIVALECGQLPIALADTLKGIAIFKKRNDPLASALGLFQQGVTDALMFGRTASGAEKLRESLAITTEALGKHNLYTLLVQGQLGYLQSQAKKFPEAEATLEGGFETAKILDVLTHPKMEILVRSLCSVLVGQKKRDRAKQVIAQWLQAHERQNKNGLRYADALTSSSQVFAAIQEHEEERLKLMLAEAIYLHKSEPQKRKGYVQNQFRLGANHARAARWPESEKRFAEVVRRIRQWYPNRLDDDDFADGMSSFATAQFRQGKYTAEMEQELARLLEPEAKKSDAKLSEEKVRVRIRLAEFYRQTGDPDKCVRLLTDLARLTKDGYDLADAASELIRCTTKVAESDRNKVRNAAVNLLAAAALNDYKNADAMLKSDAFGPFADDPGVRAAIDLMRKKKE